MDNNFIDHKNFFKAGGAISLALVGLYLGDRLGGTAGAILGLVVGVLGGSFLGLIISKILDILEDNLTEEGFHNAIVAIIISIALLITSILGIRTC